MPNERSAREDGDDAAIVSGLQRWAAALAEQSQPRLRRFTISEWRIPLVVVGLSALAAIAGFAALQRESSESVVQTSDAPRSVGQPEQTPQATTVPAGSGATTTSTVGVESTRPTPLPEAVDWLGARLGDNGRELVIVVLADAPSGDERCDSELHAQADESVKGVDVVISATPVSTSAPVSCNVSGEGRQSAVTLWLNTPLDDRLVVYQGSERPVLRAPLAQPAFVPEDLVRVAEEPGPLDSSGELTWLQEYRGIINSSANAIDCVERPVQLTLVQGKAALVDDTLRSADRGSGPWLNPTRSGHWFIRSSDGASGLAWHTGEQGYVLSSTTDCVDIESDRGILRLVAMSVP